MEQDPEDILIELLNGRRGLFSSTAVSAPSNEVFLDNKGRPTDRFLEALKRTGTSVSSQRDDDASDTSDSSSTVDSREDEDDEEEDVFERSWSRKSRQKKTTGTRGATEGKANEHRGNRSVEGKEVKGTKTKTSSNKNTSKSSVNNSTIKGRSQQTPHPHQDTTAGGDSGSPVHTTLHTHDASTGGVSADSKEMKMIRSLQLRLSGQLQTIRVLEGQLSESNNLLETRTKQLSLADSRLKQMQLSMDNMNKGLEAAGGGGMSSGSPPGGMPGSAASASKLLREVRAEAIESVERQRAQTDALHARWLEEQSRRIRADERSKLLKEYAERAKAQCAVVETARTELANVVEGLQARVQKYKRDCREYAIEAAAQRNAAADKEAELIRVRKRASEAEGFLRYAHADIQKLREDYRDQKVAAAMASGREELELMREREAAHKAEKRLERQLSRQATSTTAPAERSESGGGMGMGWKGDVSSSQESIGSQHKVKGYNKGLEKDGSMGKGIERGYDKELKKDKEKDIDANHVRDYDTGLSSSSQGIGFRRSYDHGSTSSPLNASMTQSVATTTSMRASTLQQSSLISTPQRYDKRHTAPPPPPPPPVADIYATLANSQSHRSSSSPLPPRPPTTTSISTSNINGPASSYPSSSSSHPSSFSSPNRARDSNSSNVTNNDKDVPTNNPTASSGSTAVPNPNPSSGISESLLQRAQRVITRSSNSGGGDGDDRDKENYRNPPAASSSSSSSLLTKRPSRTVMGAGGNSIDSGASGGGGTLSSFSAAVGDSKKTMMSAARQHNQNLNQHRNLSQSQVRNSRSSSPIPDDSSLAKQRFERLQHMYDRVTAAKDSGRLSWQDSDSEDSKG